MLSGEFLGLVSFFVVISFWANFYIGTFDVRLRDSQLSLTPLQQQDFARLFTFVMTCGVVAIPVVGTLMDRVGYTATSAVTIGLGLVWCGLLFVPAAPALVASFVLYTCFRTFFFTFLFAYIADTMGFKYFGALSGVMFAVGGLVGVLQYYLAQYASGTCHLSAEGEESSCSHGRWNQVNALMAATIFLCFLFSYKDWTRRKQLLQDASMVRSELNGEIELQAKRRLFAATGLQTGSGSQYRYQQQSPMVSYQALPSTDSLVI